MHLLKPLSVLTFSLVSLVTTTQAATPLTTDTVRLPTLTIMAEPELRAETGFVPFQEDLDQRKSLQRRVMKAEQNIQGYAANADFVGTVELLPPPTQPDMNQLPVALQHYVMAIANGLQSSDPRNGLYIMLQSVGIDRHAANVQISREQVNFGTLERSFSGMQ